MWWTWLTSYHLAAIQSGLGQEAIHEDKHWDLSHIINQYLIVKYREFILQISSVRILVVHTPSHLSAPVSASLEDSLLLRVARAPQHWYSALVYLDTIRHTYQPALLTGLPLCSRLVSEAASTFTFPSDLGGSWDDKLDSLLVRLNHLLLLFQRPG